MSDLGESALFKIIRNSDENITPRYIYVMLYLSKLKQGKLLFLKLISNRFNTTFVRNTDIYNEHDLLKETIFTANCIKYSLLVV